MKTAAFLLRAFFLFCFLGIILSASCDTSPAEEKRINVAFRLDDCSARSSTEIELKIIDTFRKNRAVITFGVIPFVCDGDIHNPEPVGNDPLTVEKGKILKQGIEDGVLDIALHGYSHQTIDADQMKEFSGLDYKTQIKRLISGKAFLEEIIGAPVTTFIPPWNQYDLNTLQALKHAGFSTLSADLAGQTPKVVQLAFLPATCGLPRTRYAVREARASADSNPLIVVLFHQYDFKEVDGRRGKMTYQQFSHLLRWLKSQKDIRLLSIKQAAMAMRKNRVQIFTASSSHQALGWTLSMAHP